VKKNRLIIFGSSPNSLRVKERVFLKCQVIPGTRKESHLACNHKAAVPSWRWRGCPVASSRISFPAPAVLCGSQGGRVWKAISRRCLRRNLPFLPGPSQAFTKYLINELGDDPHFLIQAQGERGRVKCGYSSLAVILSEKIV
jgi:hypothetical protein